MCIYVRVFALAKTELQSKLTGFFFWDVRGEMDCPVHLYRLQSILWF